MPQQQQYTIAGLRLQYKIYCKFEEYFLINIWNNEWLRCIAASVTCKAGTRKTETTPLKFVVHRNNSRQILFR